MKSCWILEIKHYFKNMRPHNASKRASFCHRGEGKKVMITISNCRTFRLAARETSTITKKKPRFDFSSVMSNTATACSRWGVSSTCLYFTFVECFKHTVKVRSCCNLLSLENAVDIILSQRRATVLKEMCNSNGRLLQARISRRRCCWLHL